MPRPAFSTQPLRADLHEQVPLSLCRFSVLASAVFTMFQLVSLFLNRAMLWCALSLVSSVGRASRAMFGPPRVLLCLGLICVRDTHHCCCSSLSCLCPVLCASSPFSCRHRYVFHCSFAAIPRIVHFGLMASQSSQRNLKFVRFLKLTGSGRCRAQRRRDKSEKERDRRRQRERDEKQPQHALPSVG